MGYRSDGGSAASSDLGDVKSGVYDTLVSLYSLSSIADDGAGTLRLLVDLVRERIEDDGCVIEVLGSPSADVAGSTIVVPNAHLSHLFREGLLEHEGNNPQRHSPFFFTIDGIELAKKKQSRLKPESPVETRADERAFDLALLLASNGVIVLNVGTVLGA